MSSRPVGTDTNHHFMPVQRRADAGGAVSPAQAQLAAKSGLAQATRPLPYVATIQGAFGRHDVSDIKTNVGGEAATASKSIFARAFTQGNRIAFAAEPDLHTAAHEAAHVIQQRAGHAPATGVDSPGDALERHADEVADAVVSGRSAEPLLDAYAASKTGANEQAVQRKSESATQESPHAKLEQYLSPNSNRVWRAIGQHMLGMEFPQPHARLTWVDQHAFTVRMLKQLESNIGDFKPLAKFDELLYPLNAMKIVGALVSPGGPWSPQVGIALAHELYLAIWASLKRLALRYLDVADSGGVAGEDRVTSDRLIASMPIDRYVAVALCEKHAVTVEPLGAKDAKAAKGKSVSLRPVTLKWEGDRDKKLWNWVRAEPPDATAEEVAAKLWVVTDNHGDKSASFNAYLLAAAPPLFGVPKRFALQNPHMAKHAPWNVLAGHESVESQLLAVAVSSARDELALASVGPIDPHEVAADKDVVGQNLRDCKDQLDFIQLQLRPWNLADRVSPAQGFIQTKFANLSTLDRGELTKWAHVIEGQKARLVRISGAVNTLHEATKKLGVNGPKDEQAAPLREILELLGVAAGTSYMAVTSETKLSEALQLQVALSVRAVQANERNMVGAVDQIREQIGDNHRTGQIYDQSTELRSRSRALQLQILGGESVDQDEMEDVSLRSEEVALDAKLLGTLDALAELNKAAREAGEGDAAIIASLFSGKYRNLPSLTKHVFDEISPIRSNSNSVRKSFDEEEKGHPSPARHRQNQEDRRRQLADGQARFAKIAADRDLQHFFKNAVETIKNQQFRTACVKVAAMIGVSVIAGSVAGLAARAVGGMLMEASGVATLEELSLVAKATKGAIGIGVDTTISAAGTSAIEGTSFGDVWKENLIINLASSAVFGTFAKYAKEQAEMEARLGKDVAKATKLGKIGRALKEIGAISVHTIWGAAMGEVAGRIVTGQAQPTAATMQDWALQGVSVAIGRHISHRITERSKAYAALGESAESKGRGLFKAAEKLQEMAKKVISSKEPKLALTLLEEHDRFLRMEIEEIDRQIARGGDHKGVLSEERRNLELAAEAAGSEGMLETKFVLVGMEELVPGALWKGSKEQIQAAIEHAKKGSQKPTVSHDEKTGRWKITVGERTYEIHEVASSAKTVDAQRAVLAGNDEDLRTAAKLIPSEKGTLNVFVHGTVDDFEVPLDGGNVTIDHRRLGKYIKSKGIEYERVKLFACSSGKHPKGAAQHLANKLGVPVLAPSDYLFIHPDGTVTIGPSQDRNTGHWIEFKPKKSESRYQKSADPQKPAASAPSEAPGQKKAKALSGDLDDEFDETMDGLRGHSDRSYDNVSEGAYGEKDAPEVAAVQPRNRAIVGTVDNPGDVQIHEHHVFRKSSVIASGSQSAGSTFMIL